MLQAGPNKDAVLTPAPYRPIIGYAGKVDPGAGEVVDSDTAEFPCDQRCGVADRAIGHAAVEIEKDPSAARDVPVDAIVPELATLAA